LDERRARARHADDEDRQGAVAAAAWAMVEQRAVEGVADARAALAVGLRIVMKGPPAGGVGLVGERVGARVFLPLLPGGGELEEQARPHGAFEARAAGE